VKVSHSNFAKVTRMVFVDVGSVVVLATCHTATTRMLSVLAYTTMARRDMAATERKKDISVHSGRSRRDMRGDLGPERVMETYCFLVLVRRVGIVNVVAGGSVVHVQSLKSEGEPSFRFSN